MQLLAYGGTKPLPFERGICQSQALEPGITSNITFDAMTAVADKVGCNTTSTHSPETLKCLRDADANHLLQASYDIWSDDINHNVGDMWLPSVDGDFLPAPPSQLIRESRFGNASMVMGWTQDDMTPYTDKLITTPGQTQMFILRYLRHVPSTVVQRFLESYDVIGFEPPLGSALSAEFYRTARIFRDLVMVYPTLYFAEGIHNKSVPTGKCTDDAGGGYRLWNGSAQCRGRRTVAGTPAKQQIFLYDFNQTILDPSLAATTNTPGMGVVHTSEIAYVYGNLSNWDRNNWPFSPSSSDSELAKHVSRTWSTFTATGNPSGDSEEPPTRDWEPKYTLQGWKDTYVNIHTDPWTGKPTAPSLYLIGGSYQSFTEMDGLKAIEGIRVQDLRGKCGVLNGEDWVGWLQY